MSIENFISRYEDVKVMVYARCKQLNARLAIVGTKSSASFLLDILKDTDISLSGIYEIDRYRKNDTFKGHAVRHAQELSRLDPEDVILIASMAQATDLYDTFQEIQSYCSCKILTFRCLLDTFSLREELKNPLKFEYDNFLFGESPSTSCKFPNWYPFPPDLTLENKTVLELGPFEGQVSLMIMNQRPKKVVAIEARPFNYAKVSVIRSLYNWENYELVLGDMHLFPQLTDDKFDTIFCAGVLYHSDKPWWLLQTCMQHCDTIVLCGHVAAENNNKSTETREVALEIGPCRFEVRKEYGWDDGLSGVGRESLWFREKDLIRYLDHYGFDYFKYGEMENSAGQLIYSLVRKKGTFL
jgi:2-polyprenyl-3-methyl-5-hydroxy-6-metoxy-1,4-benzoquinol methylase